MILLDLQMLVVLCSHERRFRFSACIGGLSAAASDSEIDLQDASCRHCRGTRPWHRVLVAGRRYAGRVLPRNRIQICKASATPPFASAFANMLLAAGRGYARAVLPRIRIKICKKSATSQSDSTFANMLLVVGRRYAIRVLLRNRFQIGRVLFLNRIQICKKSAAPQWDADMQDECYLGIGSIYARRVLPRNATQICKMSATSQSEIRKSGNQGIGKPSNCNCNCIAFVIVFVIAFVIVIVFYYIATAIAIVIVIVWYCIVM